MDATSRHWIKPLGAPASTAASSMIRAVSTQALMARGCGEMTTEFLAFKEIMDLNMTVEVGFVVGMMATITPAGAAISTILRASSLFSTPTVFVSLIDSYRFLDANWFLMILSDSRPIPVSSTASFARRAACS